MSRSFITYLQEDEPIECVEYGDIWIKVPDNEIYFYRTDDVWLPANISGGGVVGGG